MGFNKNVFTKTGSQLGFGVQFAIPALKKQTRFTGQLILEGDSDHTSLLLGTFIWFQPHLGRIHFTIYISLAVYIKSCQIRPTVTVKSTSSPSDYAWLRSFFSSSDRLGLLEQVSSGYCGCGETS